ncbi:hypothetical protein, partial [Rossellomorea marisflavi]|uniref:hypothetical protein n=1 Tax=Rossellomorea marisflavi TaxID=189381 RepID=UPI003D2EC354
KADGRSGTERTHLSSPSIPLSKKKGSLRIESLTPSSPKSAVQRRPTDFEGNRVQERSRTRKLDPLPPESGRPQRNGTHPSFLSLHPTFKKEGWSADRITHPIFTKKYSAAEAGRLRRE